VSTSAFVSLHANASTVPSVQGAETYYMSLDDSSTDEHAAATARLENTADTDGARSNLDLILWDLAQAEVLNQSAELALAVQNRLNERLGLKDRGVKQAPFAVLTGATMPAILVEVGFLSNPAEANQLENADHQQRLAEALALGIDDFVRAR
jgi:N-acetylmuramoyl-L-alanine amidase